MTTTPPQRIEFGTDGIRGIAGEYPLDAITVLQIGRAIGLYLWTLKLSLKDDDREGVLIPSVCIGRDTRGSGRMLTCALTAGLLDVGVNVSDYGLMTSPGIAYFTRNRFWGGIVITASHNPSEQNGIKIFGIDGFKLSDEAEGSIENLLTTLRSDLDLKNEFVHTSLSNFGFLRSISSPEREVYVKNLSNNMNQDFLSELGLVVDHANGAAKAYVETLFNKALPVEKLHIINVHVEINENAGSEHVRRDRSDILNAIREHNADLGIAFDGDADRVIFVTPDGMLIDGDHVLGILAVELKAQGRLKGDTVVATDMSNTGLADFLAGHGIALERTKVGDRYVMERLREKGYTLGGEQAGHVIILDDDHTCGDGLYIAVQIAAIAARNKREGKPTIAELARAIPRYPQVIASAHLNSKADLSQIPQLAELQTRLTTEHALGRINMRFSGTEPNLLRVMVEGTNAATRDGVIRAALDLIAPVANHTGSSKPVIDMIDAASGEKIDLIAP